MSKAAERLDMAMQTIGAQVHAPDAGPVAMQQANQIFRSSEHLPARVGDAASATVVRLAVEITKGLPKLVVHRLDIVLSDRPTRPQHPASQPSCRLLRHHFVCHASRPPPHREHPTLKSESRQREPDVPPNQLLTTSGGRSCSSRALPHTIVRLREPHCRTGRTGRAI